VGTQAFHRLASEWTRNRDHVFNGGKKSGGAKLTPTSGMGKALAQRLKVHGEDAVLTVMQWALTSNHKRAKFLRDNGNCTLKTLMRPSNFEEYLDLASDSASPTRQQPRRDRRDTQTDEEKAQIRAEMDEHIAKYGRDGSGPDA